MTILPNGKLKPNGRLKPETEEERNAEALVTPGDIADAVADLQRRVDAQTAQDILNGADSEPASTDN